MARKGKNTETIKADYVSNEKLEAQMDEEGKKTKDLKLQKLPISPGVLKKA